MFTAYHAIMFSIVLLAGVAVILKSSSEEKSIANNPIPVKVPESKFDLNTY